MAGVLGLPLPLPAQEAAREATLQQRIDAASAALTELDDKALACREALDSTTTGEAQARCGDFLQAVDGEVLAGYLAHCDALKVWREQFITSATDTADRTEQNLQLMIGVELVCGENALRRRTQYVAATFTLLRDGRTQDRPVTAALSRRLAELEFEASLNSERRSLRDSILRQRSRSLLENQRQWDDLENELIRQQIRNPSAAFPRNRRN